MTVRARSGGNYCKTGHSGHDADNFTCRLTDIIIKCSRPEFRRSHMPESRNG